MENTTYKNTQTREQQIANATAQGFNQPSNVITSASLTPVKPFVLPPTTPQTQATGLEGYITSNTNTIKTDAQKLQEQQQKTKDDTGSTLKSTLDSILGTNNEIANAGNTIDRTDQDTAKKLADTYTSQIEAEQLSNRRAIEALQKNNPEGLFMGGLDSRVNDMNRASVSHQADLAILQNSAIRKYDTASAIADRQLQLKLEPLKAKLENLKFFYQENKADFNKADDRLYQEAIKKSDREFKKVEEIETKIKDLKMNVAQFAGSSAAGILAKLASIDTTKPDAYDKAVAIAGKFASDPLDREIKMLQKSKLNAEIGKINKETSEVAKKDKEDIKKEEQKKNQLPVVKEKMDLVKKLLEHKGLNTRVGPAALGLPTRRTGAVGDAFGQGQDFAATVQQLTNQDTLNKLLELKAAGGTLGAVSEKELDLLQKSASKINAWEVKNKNQIGKGEWNISEKLFKEELGNVLKHSEALYKALEQDLGMDVDSYLNTIDGALQVTNSPYSLYTN